MKTAKEINSDLSYLFNHINWKQSNLDAKSVEIMNTIGRDITALEGKENVIVRDKKKKVVLARGPKAIGAALAMLAR